MAQSVLKIDGPKVRELRDRRGLTLKDFAAQLDTDKTHLSRIERNLSQPSIRLRTRILERLGVQLDDILAKVDTPKAA